MTRATGTKIGPVYWYKNWSGRLDTDYAVNDFVLGWLVLGLISRKALERMSDSE